MGPIEDTIKCLVEETFNNDSLLQSERKDIILAAMLQLVPYLRSDDHQRQCANAAMGQNIKIARQRRKMNRTED